MIGLLAPDEQLTVTDSQTLSPAQMYEQFYVPGIFAPLAQVFVPFADPKPGDRILDAACGTGIVARNVIGIAGDAGTVVGVDINSKLIDIARSISARDGLAIEWRESDATQLDLPPASFDLILCQQGLQFFGDRSAALNAFRGILRPRGRLALAVWRSIGHHAFWEAMTEIEARHLGPLGVTYDELIAPFSLGDPDLIEGLLDQAGFGNAQITFRSITARFPAREFVSKVERGYAAVIPQFVENPVAFDAFVDAVTRESARLLDRYRVGEFIQFEMPTQLVTAEA